jgi:hypothetical protein
MQRVRGFIHFKNKTVDEVKATFKDAKIGIIDMAFFKSLSRNQNRIEETGIFITGKVDNKYSSADIVSLLRRSFGLKEKVEGCDISIESEDILRPITKGQLRGNYIGIRIKPDYKLDEVYKLAEQLGGLISACDIFVRTVESEEDKPLVCIDLITNYKFDDFKDEIEKIITANNLTLGKYTFITFV